MTKRYSRPQAANISPEAIALDSSGSRAKGSTLYVTLEPCAHAGGRAAVAAVVLQAVIAMARTLALGPIRAGIAIAAVPLTKSYGALVGLLVPENHTRNTRYLQNVAVLQTILRHAGLDVRIHIVHTPPTASLPRRAARVAATAPPSAS